MKAKQTKITDRAQNNVPELPEKPTTTIELLPTEDRWLFVAKLAGKRAVVCYTARDRCSADKRLISVTIAPARLKAASAKGNKESLPVVVAVAVTIKGRWSSGWIVPLAVFKKHATSQSDFSLSVTARAAYGACGDALTGVKFVFAPNAKAA